MSQLCKRSELLRKHAAAKSKNGVVGSNGKTTPKMANATKIRPALASKKYRILKDLPIVYRPQHSLDRPDEAPS